MDLLKDYELCPFLLSVAQLKEMVMAVCTELASAPKTSDIPGSRRAKKVSDVIDGQTSPNDRILDFRGFIKVCSFNILSGLFPHYVSYLIYLPLALDVVILTISVVCYIPQVLWRISCKYFTVKLSEFAASCAVPLTASNCDAATALEEQSIVLDEDEGVDPEPTSTSTAAVGETMEVAAAMTEPEESSVDPNTSIISALLPAEIFAWLLLYMQWYVEVALLCSRLCF